MEDFKTYMTGRYFTLYGIYLLLFFLVLVLVGRIQFTEHDEWMNAYEEFRESKAAGELTEVAPRGNIYSADGCLLATSMPLYQVHMDMHTEAQAAFQTKKDKVCLMDKYVDSLALGLHQVLKEKSIAEYKALLLHNFHEQPRGCHRVALASHSINYVQLQQLQKLPILRLHPMQGGLIVDPVYKRTHPYGSLAGRTIGNVYAVQQEDKGQMALGGSGRYGLERSFEDVLRGENGAFITQMVAGKRIQTVTKTAMPGKDIVTTIDTHLQDIVESALRHMLDSVHPDWGCAVLMETKTGHIKAIANLGLQDSATYAEIENYAVNRAVEPGSTFKPIALTATIDAGYCTINDKVSLPDCGVWNYNPSHPEESIRDDEGHLGTLSLFHVITASSNIGMAKTVSKYWRSNPKGFVKKLREVGIHDSINCDLIGVAHPRLNAPQHISELMRMAYGYFVELPIIYSLAWYNAVANGGQMMRPMLVTDVKQNGEVLTHYDPEVIQQQICKPATLSQINKCLYGVVWDSAYATARKAQSKYVTIAGKTGTAQVQEHGYDKGSHRGSFVGFFPYENPEYTCIVVINNPRRGAYFGGWVAAPVVKEIAERTMAARSAQPRNISDTTPNGQHQAPIKPGINNIKKSLLTVPNVKGMGAKDAVYAIERTGMQARVQGVGRVIQQSIPAGTRAHKGGVITLTLR